MWCYVDRCVDYNMLFWPALLHCIAIFGAKVPGSLFTPLVGRYGSSAIARQCANVSYIFTNPHEIADKKRTATINYRLFDELLSDWDALF